MELVSEKKLLYKVNKHQCKLLTMCSFFNNLFTVAGNNNTVYSKNRIGYRNVHFKLQIIVFQINSISVIVQKYLVKPRIIQKKKAKQRFNLCIF